MTLIKVLRIIAFMIPVTAFLQGSRPKLSKTILYLDDEQWDSGEVSWETIPFTQYNAHIPVVFVERPPENVLPSKEYTTKTIVTPLYKKMQDDQTQLASVSAVTKMSYKELFNLDLFISELNCNIHTHSLFTPSEMFLLTALSGLAFIYNKTKETEISRLQKLYKFSSRLEYFEKYNEIKRFIMMIFIVLTCLLTRNVHSAT
jgi:hypothetical protein